MIPFQVVDGRALLPVTVNGADGVMMLDNGTPEAAMFNRDTIDWGPISLPPTRCCGTSPTASLVFLHAALPSCASIDTARVGD